MSARAKTPPVAAWLSVLLLAGGCGGGPSNAPTATGAPVPGSSATAVAAATAAPVVKPPAPAALPKEPEPGPPLPPLSYDAKGRRDPFAPISLAKDKPGLSVMTLKLAGVIRGRVPLALVEAPDGLGFILKAGDVLGDGRVLDITPNAVTFAVAPRAGQGPTTATLRLAQDS